MKIPYSISVHRTKNDINVKVDPPPVATKPEYAEHVTKRVQEVILHPSISNTISGRLRLKHMLRSVLTQLHAQGMIEPKKEKDEGTC